MHSNSAGDSLPYSDDESSPLLPLRFSIYICNLHHEREDRCLGGSVCVCWTPAPIRNEATPYRCLSKLENRAEIIKAHRQRINRSLLRICIAGNFLGCRTGVLKAIDIPAETTALLRGRDSAFTIA